MPSATTPAADIACRIVELESRDRARMAELLDHIAAFDERGCALRWGYARTTDWLVALCALDRRTAREYVRVAKRLTCWRRVAEALALRQLSYTQVREITRAEETEDEAQLLSFALGRTARQIELHVRQLRSSRSADLDAANHGRAKRSFRYFHDEIGSVRFFGRVPADQGAALIEALETAAENVEGARDDPACPPGWSRPPLSARRADALVDLLTGGGAVTQVVLHADPEALACQAERADQRGGNVLYLRDGPAVPAERARRLAGDCQVSFADLNHGRAQRLVTPHQRRAIELRDGRVCAFPGCDRTHGLQVHHLTHWIHGGATDLGNLAQFCTAHHHLLHEGRFTVRRRRDGTLAFADPRGHEIHVLPGLTASRATSAG